MKFIDMWDLDVRPGQLTTWRPKTDSLRTADWIPDGRPASYLQEAHLHGALRSAAEGRRGPSWLATTFELPGPLDLDALRAALLGWVDRHETLRSRLRPVVDGAGVTRIDRATLPSGEIDLVRDDFGTFADSGALRTRIENVLDEDTDPLVWPSFVFLTVEHGDSTTVCVGLDHLNADGYSVLLIAYEVVQLYRAAVEESDPGLTPAGSYLDFTGPEREAVDLLHDGHHVVRGWREFVAEGGGRLPEFPTPVTDGPDRPATAQNGGLDWLLDAAQARALDVVCKQEGGDLFSGILACLAMTARNRYGQERFRTLVPVHTRAQRRYLRSLGWYVGIAPVSLPVHAEDGFAQVMKEAGEALRIARPLADAPLGLLGELLGHPLEPRFMVSYMDARWVPGARRWADWNARALRSRRFDAHEVYLWVVRSHEGVYLSFRFPDSELGRTVVPAYLEEARRLVRLVAAGL
ncbi:condensation domain-containing protein [Streptomyces cinereoruber]|uniref:condensation domain-containing protein n=1 Tax=Streptomyces cinereoruber TaxID=67260 RepID=UPI003C2CC467